ncbi:MAG: hypothetical protein ACK5GN_04275 [Pseudomonadota bacterium]|jgi:hypothetical protein
MSIFLVHQERSYTAILADSLGQKAHTAGGSFYPVTAPKLVRVASGVYAAHAGTLQPAIDMLSLLASALASYTSWQQLAPKMRSIGEEVYATYSRRFASNSFDVRLALIFTGDRRHPIDIEDDVSSSIVLWELARGFQPEHVRGSLNFAGSVPMTELANTFLALPLVKNMLSQGPLAASHALIAAHAAISKLSSSISADANLVVIGDEDEHTVLHGTLLELSQAELIKG